MMIWGKLIGAIFGYNLFGFFGAIMGYWVGDWFDKGLKLHFHHIPRGRSTHIQQAFFRATFSVMGHLAKADGRVSEQEIKVAKDIMDRLELNEELRREAINLFSEGKSAHFNLNKVLAALYEECRQYPDLLRFFIEIQLEAALADGQLHPDAKHILLMICQSLRFSAQEFESLWARQWASQAFHQWYSGFGQQSYRTHQQQHQYSRQHRAGHGNAYRPQASSLQDAYGVLGVPSSANPAEIKKAYRRLMNQHHPDKLASRGLPEGMIKLAKEKTLQIRAAYDLIREHRGFR